MTARSIWWTEVASEPSANRSSQSLSTVELSARGRLQCKYAIWRLSADKPCYVTLRGTLGKRQTIYNFWLKWTYRVYLVGTCDLAAPSQSPLQLLSVSPGALASCATATTCAVPPRTCAPLCGRTHRELRHPLPLGAPTLCHSASRTEGCVPLRDACRSVSVGVTANRGLSHCRGR